MPQRILTFVLFAWLSSGCATILRHGPGELTLRDAPSDLLVIHQGQSVPLQAGDGGKVAQLPRGTERVTLHTAGQDAPVELSSHFNAGWLILDFLLSGGIGLLVDAVTKAAVDFDEVPVPAAVAQAQSRSSTQSTQASLQKPAREPAPRKTALASPIDLPPAPRPREAVIQQGKLAVLDFKNFAKDLKAEDVRYFTDVVRGATLKAAPRLEVMTRENLLVLLQATGKDAASCEGECEVDTGRRIGADAVVSGELLKVGTRYKMSLRLHETHDGRLLSTAVASGKTIDELDESAQQAATDLLAPPR